MKADKRNNRGAAARAAGVPTVIVDGKFVQAARKGQRAAARPRRGMASLWTHVTEVRRDSAGKVLSRHTRPISPDGPEWQRVRDSDERRAAEIERREAKRQDEAKRPREQRRAEFRGISQWEREQKAAARTVRRTVTPDVKGRATPKRAAHWSHAVRVRMGWAS
jgi:hypothetical protein